MHNYGEVKGILIARKEEAAHVKQSVIKGPWQVRQE
jgi:hypothetical protein